MTEQQMLQLAAKAAGHDNVDVIKVAGQWMARTRDGVLLNYLHGSGDALWLAVQLRMCVSVNDDHTSIDCSEGWVAIHQAHEGDPMAATRLAITRAAASIRTKGDGHGTR